MSANQLLGERDPSGRVMSPVSLDGQGSDRRDVQRARLKRTIRAYWVLGLLALLGAAIGVRAAEAAGGTLTIAIDTEPANLDPTRVAGWQAGRLIRNVYDRLVDIDFDLTTIRPALATSWKVSDDGKVWTFEIRDGVTFHDGTPLTTQDIAFSFNRRLDPKVGSASRGELGPLQRVDVAGPRSVRFVLNEPYAPLLPAVASVFSSIVSEQFVRKHGDDFGVRVMNGTGPLRFVEWKRGERLVFERFPEYRWGSALYQNRGPAKLERLVIRPIKDAAIRILSIRSGDVDVLGPLATPLPQAKELAADPSVKIVKFDVLQVQMLVYNTARPAMTEPVRAAINLAVDRRQVMDSLLYGFATPASTMVVPGTFGASPRAAEIGYAYDPKRAERLLEEAGWKKGPDGVRAKGGTRLDLSMVVPATAYYPDVAQLVQAFTEPLGIRIQIGTLDIGQFWDLSKGGNYDLSFYGFSWADPHEHLYRYFYSGNIPAPNYQRVNDGEFDRLVRSAATTADRAERARLYGQADEILVRKAYVGPLFHAQGVMAVRSNVQGLRAYGEFNAGWPQLLDVTVGP